MIQIKQGKQSESGFLTVAVSIYLAADQEVAFFGRFHFCSDEGHRGHLHGDFSMV